MLPYNTSNNLGVIVQKSDQNSAEITLRDGSHISLIGEIVRLLQLKNYSYVELNQEEFNTKLQSLHGEHLARPGFAESALSGDLTSLMEDSKKIQDLLDSDDDAPIIKLINLILTQALRDLASDIHIEPYSSYSVVRFRIDGQLKEITRPISALHAALVSRIKVMADLDIAEKRLPQDGRMSVRVAGSQVDVRVSVLPTGQGERVVMRLLTKNNDQVSLEKLGLDNDLLNNIKQIIKRPNGIFLVTGPTGSGKTTTLYAALAELDKNKINIATAEDPIEYEIEGISQTQINSRIGMDFPSVLRALLRQDPDVILIGEIRDAETARIAVQASLTGHLVMATLHTNDSVSAITRLNDIGVESYLLGSSLVGVLAQRLVRMLCTKCKKPYSPTAAEWSAISSSRLPERLYHSDGCPECNYTGYKGRTGVFEFFPISMQTKKLIHDRFNESDLYDQFISEGNQSLIKNGLRWVLSGDTSVDELLRMAREQ
jgi:general secretion pathway protein E